MRQAGMSDEPKDFLALFEMAAQGPEKPSSDWDLVIHAQRLTETIRVQLGAPNERGWQARFRSIDCTVDRHGAPPTWSSSMEVDAWVMKYDRDRNVLALVAWNPRTGPT